MRANSLELMTVVAWRGLMEGVDTAALYREYGPLVLRRARALLGTDDEAKDALQEVFVRVINNLSTFRQESSPATWLYRITTNHCLNRLRSRRTSPITDTEAPDAHSPSHGGAAEARTTLRRILQQVDQELAEIAVYYYVDEMDQEEIAQAFGVSRRTIGNRLEEFRTRAKALMEGA